MSFIGNTPTQQAFTAAVDVFSGNGSTTAFTLSRPVASVAQVEAVIENVQQSPVDAYTVSGNTITFTSAPPSGSSNIYVRYTSPITQVIAPSDGAVGTSQLATGAVTQAKLGANVAGNGPAFSAYNSTSQTVTTGTWTKATFDSEEFDTNSNFASSRFTPTVAGYYHLIYEVDAYGAGNNIYGVAAVYKNGSAVKRGIAAIVTATQTEAYLGLSTVVYLNGTSDYVEVYVNLTSTGTIQLFGTSPLTGYFQGYLARAA